MLSINVAKSIIVIALMLTLTGCVATTSSQKDSLSKQEKVALYLQMGVRYLDIGKLDIAKEKLDMAYDLDPRNADVHNALAVLYERLGEIDKASDYYRSAIKLSPDDASIKNNYGRFLCDHDRYNEGIALLSQSVQMPLNNRKWLALTNLGRCHLKQGQSQQAEQMFRQALQLQPNYAPALMEMQQISYKNRNYMSARAFLERYLSVANHTPQTLWVAIQTERALGNRELTEKYRRQLLSMYPESEQAQQVRSSVYR